MSSKKRIKTTTQRTTAGAATGLPVRYLEFLEDIKSRIRSAQVKAALSANREMILLYWDLGKSIVERQRKEGWGKAVVDRLACDLQTAFPGIGGFSRENVRRMRAFYLAYTEEVSIQSRAVTELDGIHPPRVVTEIPWGQNQELLFKIKDPLQRRHWDDPLQVPQETDCGVRSTRYPQTYRRVCLQADEGVA